MKVVVLHPPLYPINHALFNLLGQYVDLTVYNFGEYPRLHENWSIYNFQKQVKNYEIKIFGSGPISYRTQIDPRFILELKKDKPEIVISVAFWFPSLYASLLKKIFGYTFLISTDAILETEKNISKTRKFIRRIICRNTDAFISASNLTSEYLSYLYPNIDIKFSLQTIDVNTWTRALNSLPRKRLLRDELDLPTDKTILLGVGGFTVKKNWEAVFNQMEELNDCIFILIGSGELKNEYENRINMDLKDKVRVVSRKEGIELKKYFKASDIFIFPSLYDQFGYVVLEALSSGLPVVCSKNAGASSLIQDGKNGFVIDPNKEFSDEIKIIISNLEGFQQAAPHTMEKFTLENKAEEMLDIFRAIYVDK